MSTTKTIRGKNYGAYFFKVHFRKEGKGLKQT
jgi:hypothetical protein